MNAVDVDYDIAIAGGGMVGATLACALASSGYRVAVLEARPPSASSQPSYDERTVSLAYTSKRILEAVGVWDLLADATPIEALHVSQRGRFGATRLHHSEEGVPALGYVVANRDLGAALYARLSALADIDVLMPAKVGAVDVAPEDVSLALDGTAAGEVPSRLTCRLLVAADGAGSAVRERLGIGLREHDYQQTAIVTNVTPARAHRFTAYERFTDQGPLALLPMSEGRCALVWTHASAHAETTLDLDDTRFLRELQAAFGYRLGTFDKVGERQAYALKLIRARELVRPRVALIGDAAHALHPVAAQGLNLGLRDVAVLAELLHADSAADPGSERLVNRFAFLRRAETERVTRFTDGLARLFTYSWAPLAWARSAGLVAVDVVAPLRHGLARRNMGLAGRPPRLASGLALGGPR